MSIIRQDPTTKEWVILWHIRILPRMGMIAGFELGSGISINSVLPEQSAPFIREFNG